MSPQRKSIIAWCLYDAGNSAFATVIITFVFSVYFSRGVIGDEIAGTALWGYAIAASGFIVALASPVLGAVADHYGARKPWIAFFSALCVMATAALYFAAPGSGAFMICATLAALVIANATFEIALVFANAMLPDLAPESQWGRVSGWAWGVGYAGGLACLALALFGLVGLGDMAPLIALPQDQSEHVRATALLTALWFALFTLPLLVFSIDAPRAAATLRQAIGLGMAQLGASLRTVRYQKNLLTFLIASALYRDGLNTLFAMGGLYAAGTYKMDFTDILIFAIGLNVTAALGAGLFAFVDDFIGSKKTIMIALVGLIVTGIVIMFIDDKNAFIALALVLGVFMGPAQAAGRTLAARLAPPHEQAQTFGLYAFTGKTVSFIGPLLFALATSAFGTQRAGFATIILLWVAGMALLARVKEVRTL